MNKVVIGIVIAVIVIVATTMTLMVGNARSNDKQTPLTQQKTAQTQSVTVTYTDDGFKPQNITVAKGTTVNFINKSYMPLWVASDPHPEHTDYPEFDSAQANGGKLPEMGQDFSFVFQKTGTWKYHSHTASSDVGTEEVHPGTVTVE